MKIKPELPLLDGEFPVDNAPSVQLRNGGLCIPQHYLRYHHSRQSVEKIILDIDYNDRYLIFVCEDDTGIYIQIGIIGFDNYRTHKSQQPLKVVYGRKWRVEPQLPTSEIIQTTFLALKKAREHEVREVFRLTCDYGFTTPFNNHHDLPLISQNSDLVRPRKDEAGVNYFERHLKNIRYDRAELYLKNVELLANGKWLINIEIIAGPKGQLPEIRDMDISFLMSTLNINELYYRLMDEFLSLSDRHVDENFLYKGFARFSRNNSITAIAELSSLLRQRSLHEEHHAFASAFETAIYETDKSRVPKLGEGPLSEKIRVNLARFGQLEGILPG
ncbi:hypothetical protein MNBD_ALPHA02-314 [hydrothermal vent metagenome]|uniref:Uncharacterized protein n=1 Tax=hydrothermal vent metagenome TaxID=652676 RepID=A0A3B0R3S8_9ZZZZ